MILPRVILLRGTEPRGAIYLGLSNLRHSGKDQILSGIISPLNCSTKIVSNHTVAREHILAVHGDRRLSGRVEGRGWGLWVQ